MHTYNFKTSTVLKEHLKRYCHFFQVAYIQIKKTLLQRGITHPVFFMDMVHAPTILAKLGKLMHFMTTLYSLTGSDYFMPGFLCNTVLVTLGSSLVERVLSTR